MKEVAERTGLQHIMINILGRSGHRSLAKSRPDCEGGTYVCVPQEVYESCTVRDRILAMADMDGVDVGTLC